MATRFCVALALLGLAATSVVAAAADKPPTYTVYRNATPPTLDGVIAGDPGWAGIPGATGYHKLGDGYTMDKQTTAYATWDDASLYIGIIAEEPDIAKVHSSLTDGSNCWLEDSAELFLQAPGRGALQFAVTSGGARASGAGDAGLEGWEAKASRSATGYTLEIRFSFALLGVTPKPGGTLRGNFCRNIFTTDSGGDKYTSWAPLEGRFLEPENFAVLRLEARALSEAEGRAAEQTLNAAYRGILMAQLADLAKAAEEYRPLLARAAADPKTRARAEPLKAGWDKAVDLQRQAAEAPLIQVRSTLQASEELRRKSYEFKYQLLIDELFEGDA